MSKIYVFPQGSVVYDGSILTAEQKARAVEVDGIYAPEHKDGFHAVLRADKKTETIYYEYIKNDEAVELRALLDDALSLLIEAGVI